MKKLQNSPLKYILAYNCPDRISAKERIENWVVGVSISVTNNCSDSDKLLHRVLLCFFFLGAKRVGMSSCQ